MERDQKQEACTTAGVKILRHFEGARRRAPHRPEAQRRILAHLAPRLGEPIFTFRQREPELVRVEVHVFKPRPGQDHALLVTTGMSDRPMRSGCTCCRYAELALALPWGWPLGPETARDERAYWPIRWLEGVARMPHEHESWVWGGHTVADGAPGATLAPGVPFCCLLLDSPRVHREALGPVKIARGKTVHFFSLVPLHRDEMNLKLTQGPEALAARLEAAGVTEVFDPGRPSVARGRFMVVR